MNHIKERIPLKKKGILYLIVDFSAGEDKIEEALKAGVDIVQLREKNITEREYLKRAMLMREMTNRYHTIFLVNDRVDIALACGADGVHLGNDDLPVEAARRIMGENALIGATARTAGQAVKAEEMGADYLGSGAWAQTDTKRDAVPILDETFLEIVKSVSIPDVAVGGITAENCRRPLSLGASGLAVSSGILKAPSVGAAVRQFRKKLELECV